MQSSQGSAKSFEEILEEARSGNAAKDYPNSFNLYETALGSLPPADREPYLKEFLELLSNYEEVCLFNKKFGTIYRCYRSARNVYPNNGELHVKTGDYAFMFKEYWPAKHYYEAALLQNPSYLPAQCKLMDVNNCILSQKHCAELNDEIKHIAFARAIAIECRKVREVIDAVAGAGINTLFSYFFGGIRNIFGFNPTSILCSIYNDLISTEGLPDVTITNRQATDLTVPDDVPERGSYLLIADAIDSGIFGDDILRIVSNAWQHVLAPFPGSRVIPQSVEINICAYRCHDLTRKYRTIKGRTNILNIDMFNLCCNLEVHDTAYIRKQGIRFMTDSVRVLTVNFNNSLQLKTIERTSALNPTVYLRTIASGHIDGFLVWFRLNLNDSVYLTNDPHEGNARSWNHAILKIPAPVTLPRHSVIPVKLAVENGQMRVLTSIMDTNCPVLNVPREIVMFLNDVYVLGILEGAANSILSRCQVDSSFKVLDLYPVPVFGLFLAKHGAQVTCRIENSTVKTLVQMLCDINDIDFNNIHIHEYMTFKTMVFDVAISNPFNLDGTISETGFCEIPHIRNSVQMVQGLYLPQKIYVVVQLVECPWLIDVTKVNAAIVGSDIANRVNAFQGNLYKNFIFRTINFKELSKIAILTTLSYDNDLMTTNTNIKISNPGTLNALFYWFYVTMDENVAFSTRRFDSHINNTAVVFHDNRNVERGEIITLTMKQHLGHLKFTTNYVD